MLRAGFRAKTALRSETCTSSPPCEIQKSIHRLTQIFTDYIVFVRVYPCKSVSNFKLSRILHLKTYKSHCEKVRSSCVSWPIHTAFRFTHHVLRVTSFGAVVAWTLAIHLRPLYSLMLATLLMTLFYALYSRRTTDERRRFMARLRPFLAGQERYTHQLDDDPPDGTAPRRRFIHLCHDVLGARAAALVPTGTLTTLIGVSLRYGNDLPLPEMSTLLARFAKVGDDVIPLETNGWAVALSGDDDPDTLNGVLILGQKSTDNPYTEEEIELARASCERIMDALANVELARLTLDLLRQRLAQARVLEGRGRRLLHDDVLPLLHTAILGLSGGDTGRSLHVTLRVTTERGLTITVTDDGVGLQYSNVAEGTRIGLRFHNAMLTAIGGTLSVTPPPDGGTRAVLHLPPETLRRLTQKKPGIAHI
jgi:hypothetical protein